MMKNPRENIDYIKFARHFTGKQVEELVASFNREVGNKGWVGIRGFYDVALIDEFIRRGIDVSAVSDGGLYLSPAMSGMTKTPIN